MFVFVGFLKLFLETCNKYTSRKPRKRVFLCCLVFSIFLKVQRKHTQITTKSVSFKNPPPIRRPFCKFYTQVSCQVNLVEFSMALVCFWSLSHCHLCCQDDIWGLDSFEAQLQHRCKPSGHASGKILDSARCKVQNQGPIPTDPGKYF